jgi:aconitate hydratase
MLQQFPSDLWPASQGMIVSAGEQVALSLARIHETNLKKQGLLVLTFDDPGDYNRICLGDRVSLVDLEELSEGSSVKCVVTHRDGRSELLLLGHSYTNGQLHWFRVGSALNTIS